MKNKRTLLDSLALILIGVLTGAFLATVILFFLNSHGILGA